MTVHPQFLTDASGKRTSVMLSFKEYEKIIEELEIAEDLRIYNEVKARNEKAIPIEEAFKKLDAKRKKA